MLHIGAFEAKNTLGSLLDRVEKGEEILITRHGRPVAKLVRSVSETKEEKRARIDAAFARIEERAKSWNLGPWDWEGKYKLWRDEGRR